ILPGVVEVESAEPAPVAPRVAKARRSWPVRLGFVAALAALVGLGYAGALQLAPDLQLRAEASRLFWRVREAIVPPTAAPKLVETSVQSAADTDAAIGKIEPGVDASRGVAVGNDEGLLVIEHSGPEPSPVIRIDGMRHPGPPLSLALPVGPHQLTLQSELGESSYTLLVRSGTTRVIALPLPSP
ncbi:MAG: hypothetical protein ABW321_20655, partial [Polyangiales bacterium]